MALGNLGNPFVQYVDDLFHSLHFKGQLALDSLCLRMVRTWGLYERAGGFSGFSLRTCKAWRPLLSWATYKAELPGALMS